MFNVNLNSNPGIQSDKISSSIQIDKPVDEKNITSNTNKKKENEVPQRCPTLCFCPPPSPREKING